MEVEQLEYQGTLTSTPHAQVDVMPNPEATPARADRDWRLVEALRLREPTAADRLVATYGDRAYRLAVRIAGNEQDAEEAVRDAVRRGRRSRGIRARERALQRDGRHPHPKGYGC